MIGEMTNEMCFYVVMGLTLLNFLMCAETTCVALKLYTEYFKDRSQRRP